MANLNINTTDNQINITPTDTQVRIYTGGFATPGGANTEVQYNDNGRLAGAANITYTNGNMVISNNNFKITGGDNGYFLQTDGQGNLTWYPGTAFPTGNGQVGGANTQIQFNNSGNFGGVAGFTMNPITTNVNMPNNLSVVGNVSANYFIGNGSQLTGISVDSTQIVNGNSNVKVTANGNVTVSVAGNANVLTVTGTDVSATGNVSASYFIGNGISLSGLTGANVIGVVANATYAVSAGSTNTANTAITAGTVTTNAQPNITSIGTLTSLTIAGTGTVQQIKEKYTSNNTGSAGTVNFDLLTSAIINKTANATANFTLNFRGNSSTTLDSVINSNESITCTYINLNGLTAYVPTSITIDGAATTVVWSGNTAGPGVGTQNGRDMYTFNILKSSANTYTVFSSRVGFI